LAPHEKALVLQKHIGFIYQVPHLIDELSLVENVMIKGLIASQPYNESQKTALELLSQVGLADKAAQRPRTLSGGEQQRVAIARALFSGPSFILADEPTAHLDKATAQVLVDLILSYKNESGIIMVSHDTRITEQLDHRVSLSNGALFEDLPPLATEKEHYV
jgi:ABC-type lipoprotein export system ATPase subunit